MPVERLDWFTERMKDPVFRAEYYKEGEKNAMEELHLVENKLFRLRLGMVLLVFLFIIFAVRTTKADEGYLERYLSIRGHGAVYVPVPLPYQIYVNLYAPVPQPLSRRPILKLPRQERFLLIPHVLHGTAINRVYRYPFEQGLGLKPPYFMPVSIKGSIGHTPP